MNFLFARSPKFNKWVRWLLCLCMGGAFLANTHYSVQYLSQLSGGNGGRLMLLTHILTSITVTVLCLCLMGAVTNPAFWSFMIDDLQDHFKKMKGIGSYIGFAVTAIILCVLFGAMFFLYQWDLVTTQFGLGLGGQSLLSTAAVPAWALVFAPDLGAIAWNISNESDKRTRSLRGNGGGGGRKSSPTPTAMPAPSQGGGGLGGLFK
jgi:hypothetical protein